MATKYTRTSSIIAVEIVGKKLEVAKELGGPYNLNSKEKPNVVEAIKDITNGGATYAIDCTGILRAIDRLYRTYPVAKLGDAIHDLHIDQVRQDPSLYVTFSDRILGFQTSH